MYKQRTNSCDSISSSKQNDNSIDNSPNESPNPIQPIKKRKMKLRKSQQKLISISVGRPKRQCIVNDDKIISNISVSSLSSSTDKSKVSTRESESSDSISEDSLDNNPSNNENNCCRDEEDPFEPTSLDMKSKENSNILKTLFLEKTEIIETIKTTTTTKEGENDDKLELMLNKCKKSLVIESSIQNTNEILKEIKVENKNCSNYLLKSPQPQQQKDKNEVFKEVKSKIDEYKKLIEEKSKNEMEIIKQDFERLVKELQFNSGMLINQQVSEKKFVFLIDLRIKEIIEECNKEKFKMQKKHEQVIEDIKRKQWVLCQIYSFFVSL
jgi:hypothetical protein